jgi:hypothetical protein
MDTAQLLKVLGINDETLKAKSELQVIDFITEKAKEAKPIIAAENEKKFLENYTTHAEKFRETLANPFEVYVREVLQKKSLTAVKIVGYIPETKQLIAYYSGKLCQIPDENLITNELELKDAKEQDKARKTAKKS